MNCPNCKRSLSCGCQRATAKNGAVVCNSCVAQYNASLENNNSNGSSPGSTSGNTPIIKESLTITAPDVKTGLTPDIVNVKYNNFQS